MASAYKRTWSDQGRPRAGALGRRLRPAPVFGPVAPMARPELQRAIGRLLDGSFQPRVTTRRNPKQLELFTGRASLPRRPLCQPDTDVTASAMSLIAGGGAEPQYTASQSR